MIRLFISNKYLLNILFAVCLLSVNAQAQVFTSPGSENEQPVKFETVLIKFQQAQTAVNPGGWKNGLKSLIFGPRVGLEANEGMPVGFVEKANVFVPLSPFEAYGLNGIRGFAASAFFGPRAGMQFKERKIRTAEWISLLPVAAVAYHLFTSDPSTGQIIAEVGLAGLLSRIYPAFEAFRGKTMSEIHSRENLGKN